MSNEYVPTTDAVRRSLVYRMTHNALGDRVGDVSFPEAEEAFDRWLASMKAEAWDAGWNAGYGDRISSTRDRNHHYADNPHRPEGVGL